MPNLPRFIVAGAPRCGTTSLFYYLQQHPGIDMPRKETFFFASTHYRNLPPDGPPRFRDRAQLVSREEDYDRLFSGSAGKTTGEISTCYGFLHATSIPLIREKLGDVPIVFLLRNPVHRAWSGYRHFVRLGYERLAFEEALQREAERRAAGWDFMWQYEGLGRYAGQVKAFTGAFSRVKVILSESFFERPAETMHDLFGFIGVDSAFRPDTRRRYNFSHEDRAAWRHRLVQHPVTVGLLKPLARAMLPRSRRLAWRERLRVPARGSGPSPDAAIARRLLDGYRDDIAALQRLTGLDLHHWLETDNG